MRITYRLDEDTQTTYEQHEDEWWESLLQRIRAWFNTVTARR